MLNKIFWLFFFIVISTSTAFADEIVVGDADTIWDLTLNSVTDIEHLEDEPDIMVVKYADTFLYTVLENVTGINRLMGEPGVIVVKYADTHSYIPLENPDDVDRLTGEPGVMVIRYADTILDTDLTREIYVLNLTIDYPDDGSFIPSPSVTVRGTVSSPNDIVNVTVNGVLANGTTSWSATIPLTSGENTITIKVVDSTGYSGTMKIKVFHFLADGCDLNDADGDGVIDAWDQDNTTQTGFWVNPQGIGRMLGDLNNNGMLDSGDVTILMRKIAGLVT